MLFFSEKVRDLIMAVCLLLCTSKHKIKNIDYLTQFITEQNSGTQIYEILADLNNSNSNSHEKSFITIEKNSIKRIIV